MSVVTRQYLFLNVFLFKNIALFCSILSFPSFCLVRWTNPHISFTSDPPDVGASLANDELVGLLDDEDLYLVAALNLLLGNLGIGFISDPPDVGATLTDDAIVGLLDSGDLDCYSEKLLEQLSWLYWQL